MLLLFGREFNMNPLHLLWIVPLSAGAGAFIMALLAVNNSDPPTHDQYGVEFET